MRRNMKLLWALAIALVAAAAAFGQGTTVPGPLTVTAPQGGTVQSGIILVDIGLQPQSGAAKQYVLTIANGILVECDQTAPCHSLVGPQGPQGAPGANGINGTNGVNGTN